MATKVIWRYPERVEPLFHVYDIDKLAEESRREMKRNPAIAFVEVNGLKAYQYFDGEGEPTGEFVVEIPGPDGKTEEIEFSVATVS